MATVNTPFIPSDKSQQALLEYTKQATGLLDKQWNLRENMRNVDLAYAREENKNTENVRAKIANRYGDAARFQDMTVPIVMPQVEAATTYQASVFLSGNPIFGVVSPPSDIDAALMLESIIENQQIRAGWTRELLMFFRDGFKYNISALEVNWDKWYTAQLTTDLSKSPQGVPQNKIWEGNRLKRWDMYNTFFDTRVAPSRVYCEGEFAGNVEVMSRIRLKQFINELSVKINVTDALTSGTGSVTTDSSTVGFYIPSINPDVLKDETMTQSTNWMAWAGLVSDKLAIQYKDLYKVTTMYCKIIPNDFGFSIPERNTPQIFKLIVVNDSVVLYVERQTNAHGWLPVLFGVPNEDGLKFQTKSYAQNAIPFQQLSSAMMNSVIASRRRAISDRVLYDPSRVPEHLINSPNPSAKIPVRPSAYGKNIAESVYAFPFRDDQASVVLQEVQTVIALGNEANGQNKARQGQFVKGNKTQSEFQTVMNNANGRDQMTAILYESQVFTPLKEIIKINILQYQGTEEIYSKSKDATIKVDPTRMRDAVMSFKISDGLLPTDKIMDADSYTVALQTIGSSPQIGQGYNITPMFSYLMKQRGADLAPFEKSPEQVAYEQAVAAWQQAIAGYQKSIEAGTITPDKLPPQPKPADYGYTPAGATSPAANVKTNVNNITNNITDNRGVN